MCGVYNRVSGNPGHFLEFEIAVGNTGNLLEFSWCSPEN